MIFCYWNTHLSSNLSAPVRTYITQNRGKFHNVAFFIIAGGFKFDGVFQDIRELIGISPRATLGINEKEIKKEFIYLK